MSEAEHESDSGDPRVAVAADVPARWQAICSALIWAVGVLAIGLATVKARTGAPTVDEVWSYDGWISRGLGRVWTNYSATNNHIFQNVLGWLGRGLDDSMFGQRLPSLLGFALLLLALGQLLRLLRLSPPWRVLVFSLLALHPYVIDFAALARGYMLVCGLLLLATALLLQVLTESDLSLRRGAVLRTVAASVGFGLAMITVPVAVRGAFAACVAFVGILLLARVGWRRLLGFSALLGLPASVIVLATYLPLLKSFDKRQLYFGSETFLESVYSAWTLTAYIPQGTLTGGGNPDFAAEVAITPWQGDWLPSIVHRVGTAPLYMVIVLGIGLLGLTMILRFRPERRRAVGFLLVVALLPLLLISLEHSLLGVRLPLNRTWLPMLLPVLLATYVGVVEIAEAYQGRERVVGIVVTLALLLPCLLNSVGRIRPTGPYWEWPDFQILPAVYAEILRDRPEATPCSLTHPWHLGGAMRYLQRQNEWEWIDQERLLPGQAIPDYILYNEVLADVRVNPALYEVLQEYPEHQTTLYARRDR